MLPAFLLTLGEAAVRSLVLGLTVWLAFKALRIRNARAELTAWIGVLAVSQPATRVSLAARWEDSGWPTAAMSCA